MAAALAAGTRVEREERLPQLRAFLAAEPSVRAQRYKAYAGLFLAGEAGDRRPRASLLAKDAKAAVPTAEAVMLDEAERLLELEARVAAAGCLRLTEASLLVADALLRSYEARKRAQGALDYQDLLQKTAALLERPGTSAWVLFKLDGGLDHVLIDEAQDTSPLQWQIVSRLTEEFYAGAGAAEAPRSVFAVGDSKQSIYRFQGADPAAFARAARDYEARAAAARLAFLKVPLTHSFRSAPAVLAAVDAVFAAAPPMTGEPHPPHRAIRAEDAGLVRLYPRHLPEQPAAEDPWTPPVVQARAVSPAVALAEELAGLLASWLAGPAAGPGGESNGEAWLESKGRAMEPGDVLILVRRRDALFHALARALESRGLPIAGVDRMLLTQQLAVMDLLALMQVLLLPEDDLSLAALLKGPLYGLEEESLYALAQGRRGTLWAELLRRAGEAPAWQAALEEIQALRAQLDYLPPFELLAQLLGARGGRRRLCARLGEESGDPLDELLSLALAYEREHLPSLQGFLGWLTRSEVEVKRDMEAAGRKIRLMTVHGAKGLQAPVVLLPDTGASQVRQNRLLVDREAGLLARRVAGSERVPLLRALAAEERVSPALAADRVAEQRIREVGRLRGIWTR